MAVMFGRGLIVGAVVSRVDGAAVAVVVVVVVVCVGVVAVGAVIVVVEVVVVIVVVVVVVVVVVGVVLVLVTVTVKDAGVALLPAGSCALHVTVVMPMGNSPPARLWSQLTVIELGSLSGSVAPTL